VGLSIAVAWGVRDLWRRLDGNPRVLTGAGVVCAVLLGVGAWVQVGHWRDTETLFRRAIAVEEGNFVAHRILGDEYLRRGAIERAALHYRASLHIKGDSVLTHSRLAAALARLGRAEDAVVNLEIAAGLDPGSLRRTLDLARGLVAAGRSEEARGLAEDALRTAQDRGDVAMATAFAELLGSLGDSDQSR
jgi:tetratricopeptide (TPR) repeat protein